MVARTPIGILRTGNPSLDKWGAQVVNMLRTVNAQSQSVEGRVTQVIRQIGGGPGENGPAEEPTQPMGLEVVGAYSTIMLSWSMPSYQGHAVTEIWRSAEDDFGTAIQVAEVSIGLWSDAPGPGMTFYYWIRHRNTSDLVGPINDTAGTIGKTSESLDELFDLVSGEITEDYLNTYLSNQIALVSTLKTASDQLNQNLTQLSTRYDGLAEQADALGVRVGGTEHSALTMAEALLVSVSEDEDSFDKEGQEVRYLRGLSSEVRHPETGLPATLARLIEEETVRSTQYESAVSRVSGLEATVFDPVQGLQKTWARLLEEESVRATQNSAAVQRMNSLEATVFDPVTGLPGAYSKLLELEQVVAQEDYALSQRITQLNASMTYNDSLLNAEIDSLEQAIVTNQGGMISRHIDNYRVWSGGNYASLQQVAQVSYNANYAYESQWGITTNVNGLKGGVGFYNNGSRTLFAIKSDRMAIIDPRNNQVSELFTVVQNDPQIPSGVYMNKAFIKVANIRDLVAGSVVADTVSAGASMTSPSIYGGLFSGGRISLTRGAYTLDIDPGSNVPLYYSRTGVYKSSSNATFAVSDTGKVYARELTVRNAAGQVMMDAGGFNGAYINNLQVGTLQIEGNAVTVPHFVESSTYTGTSLTLLTYSYNQAMAGQVMASFTVLARRLANVAGVWDAINVTLKFYAGNSLVRTVYMGSVFADPASNTDAYFSIPIMGSAYINSSSVKIVLEVRDARNVGQRYTCNARGFLLSAKR